MLLPQKTRMQFSRNTFCNYFIYIALSGSKRLRESSSLLFHPAQRLAQIINICWYDRLVESHFLSSSEIYIYIYISQLWEAAKTIWVHLSPPIWRERPKRPLESRGHVTTYSLATCSANTSVVCFPQPSQGWGLILLLGVLGVEDSHLRYSSQTVLGQRSCLIQGQTACQVEGWVAPYNVLLLPQGWATLKLYFSFNAPHIISI